jgi:hypothetical protein
VHHHKGRLQCWWLLKHASTAVLFGQTPVNRARTACCAPGMSAPPRRATAFACWALQQQTPTVVLFGETQVKQQSNPSQTSVNHTHCVQRTWKERTTTKGICVLAAT